MNYCSEEEDYVTDEHCADCDECNKSRTAKERLAKAAPLDPEIAEKLKEQLSVILGFKPEEVDSVIARMCNRHRDAIVAQVGESLTKLSQDYMKLQAEKQFQEYLDRTIEEELSASLTIVSKDSDFMKTTIREIVTNKIKEVLSSDSYNSSKKKYVEERLENVISERVDGMVAEALEELKAESIDKFNKEVMKKMMGGMAKAISNDKRLLTLLEA